MKAKRGQNQGSVYQRGSDDRWVAQVTEAGKHHLAYFHSPEEAHRWLTFALLQIHLKRPLSTRQTPIGVYFDTWLDHLAPTIRPKTLLQYRQIISSWQMAAIGTLGVVIGTLSGKWALRRIPQDVFRTVVASIILALGIWMLMHPGS